MYPHLFIKELSDKEVSRLKALVFKKSRDISIRQYLASRAAFRAQRKSQHNAKTQEIEKKIEEKRNTFH